MSIEYKDPNNTLLTGGVIPNNKLWFFKGSWWDSTYENSLWFSTLSDQNRWYDNCPDRMLAVIDYTYAIKDDYSVDFRVPYSTEDLQGCTYMCRVKDYNLVTDTRWYYFVNSFTAYSPNSTVVHCTLDVIQTFMFEWKLGKQHILRTNGTLESGIRDVRCFTNEDFMPAIEECSSTIHIDDVLTDSSVGFSGHMMSTRCYLVVCTEYWYYDVDTQTDEFVKLTSSGFDDPSELNYCVFKTLAGCMYFLDKYTGTDKNKIKGVYGIPYFCAFGGTRLDGNTETVITLRRTDGTSIGWVKQTGARKYEYQITVPTSFYGYTPYINKTRMIHCLSIESRTGKSAMFKMTDIDFYVSGGSPVIKLTIIGILSIAPKIIIVPHEVPESGNMKSSNYVSFDINPSFSVFDDAGQEIYNKNYEAAINKNNLSMIGSAISATLGGLALALPTGGSSMAVTIAALAGIVGGEIGAISGAITDANLKATYQAPQNMIGTCDADDAWFTGMNEIIIRWLSPTEQNLKAFDVYLATNGYNYSGKIDECGTLSANGRGVNMFGRPYFNFIQLDHCKVVFGNCGIYKEKIEDIFNTGIRFWNVTHPQIMADGIGNYTSAILSGNQSAS